jgi:hypothetical protein
VHILSNLVSQDVQRGEAVDQRLEFRAALSGAFYKPVSILDDALYERGLLFRGPARFDLDETARTFHPEQRSLEDLIRLRPFAEWIVVSHISIIVKQQGRMRPAPTDCLPTKRAAGELSGKAQTHAFSMPI